MDHQAMREALTRALDEVYNDFCINCKNPFEDNQGSYIDFITYYNLYKIWYCNDCFQLLERKNYDTA